jgi:ApeA N-terminal domain 1
MILISNSRFRTLAKMATIEPTSSEQRGEFWLPATPDTRIAGALRLGPPLAGHLALDGELMPGTGPEPLVHGLLFSGQPITAMDCHAAGRSSRYSLDRKLVSQKLAVKTVLIGEHVDEHPTFDRLVARLTYLREWANVRQGWDTPEEEGSHYSIAYEAPPERTAALKDGRTVTLRTVDNLTTSSSSIHGEQQTEFFVTFPEPVSLEAVMEAVASLRDLVTFAARRPASVTSLAGTCPGVLLVPGSEIQRPLELHYRQVELDPQQNIGDFDIRDSDLLFLAPDLSAEFTTLIERWLELENRLDLVLDLFLSLYYAPPLHLQNKVMNMCQVAESYDRSTMDRKLMTDDDHAALTNLLIEACPEPWRLWLKEILSHSNGPSFRVRIAELVAKAGTVGATLAGTFNNYPGRLRDCRVQYAHWLPGKALSTERVIELAALFDVTKIILEACLLQDLGWSQADAASLLTTKRDLERLSKRPRPAPTTLTAGNSGSGLVVR